MDLMGRYVGRYIGFFVGISLLLGIVFAILDIEPALYMSIIVGFCSGIWPGSAFAKDHGRAPSKSEKRRFAGITCLIVVVGTALYFLFVLRYLMTPEELAAFESLPAIAWLAILAITVLGQYFLAYFGFSNGAKSFIGKIQKDSGSTK